MFSFESVSTENISKIINEIDCSKSSNKEIPAKIQKLAKEEISIHVTNCINKCDSKKYSKKSFMSKLKNFQKRSNYPNSAVLEKALQFKMHF